MKKILSLVVLVAAVAMVGCCGGQKKAEDKGCSCCPKTECAQPACPQGEKNCAECPQKATCPQAQAEAAPAETPAQ